MNELNKVLDVALNEEGYLEKKSDSQLDDKTANAGSNNFTKFARDLDNIPNFYNGKKNGYAWCDVFVDWCFVKAFGVERAKELLNQPSSSLGAGTGYSANYYKNKNQYFKSGPRKGDQIFFRNASGICHTGLVYDVDNACVYTIEGNTSSVNGVVSNGGAVARKKYKLNYSNIDGYGRPLYREENEMFEDGEEKEALNYLVETGRITDKDFWLKTLEVVNKQKWLFIKWANDVKKLNA